MTDDKKKKILIVEDEKSLSLMYKTEFEEDGYHVLIADNGAKGLEMAVKEKPDLIILDIIMPELNGFTVLKRLKVNEGTKDIPVVILTVLGAEEKKEEGEKLGATAYLVKAKLTPAEIYEKIKEYIK